jgi:hypothetical protein
VYGIWISQGRLIRHALFTKPPPSVITCGFSNTAAWEQFAAVSGDFAAAGPAAARSIRLLLQLLMISASSSLDSSRLDSSRLGGILGAARGGLLPRKQAATDPLAQRKHDGRQQRPGVQQAQAGQIILQRVEIHFLLLSGKSAGHTADFKLAGDRQPRAVSQ